MTGLLSSVLKWEFVLHGLVQIKLPLLVMGGTFGAVMKENEIMEVLKRMELLLTSLQIDAGYLRAENAALREVFLKDLDPDRVVLYEEAQQQALKAYGEMLKERRARIDRRDEEGGSERWNWNSWN